jgi:hypothetical protein
MKLNHQVFCLFFYLSVFISCKDENSNRTNENKKAVTRNKIIFEEINKNWKFNIPLKNTSSSELTAGWNDWQLFMTSLAVKPQKTIGAFQQKAKELSTKAMALNNAIPPDLNNQPIKSRISALTTRIQMLELFINLNKIPEKKVVLIINEINMQMISLENQIAKIAIKKRIPLEEGESELKSMLDSTRAIPDKPMSSQNNPMIF